MAGWSLYITSPDDHERDEHVDGLLSLHALRCMYEYCMSWTLALHGVVALRALDASLFMNGSKDPMFYVDINLHVPHDFCLA